MAVDPNIKKKADDIRNKVYGKEVRESLASGLEAMSSDVVDTVSRQSNVESRFQDVIENTTDKDVISAPEIIAARNGEANLKTRIDKDYQEVTAQLAETTAEINVARDGEPVLADRLKRDFGNVNAQLAEIELRSFPKYGKINLSQFTGLTHSIDFDLWRDPTDGVVKHDFEIDETDYEVRYISQAGSSSNDGKTKETAWGNLLNAIASCESDPTLSKIKLVFFGRNSRANTTFKGSVTKKYIITAENDVIGANQRIDTFQTHSGNVVKGSCPYDLNGVVFTGKKEANGLPLRLKKADTLSECLSTPFSYYGDGTDVYIHNKDTNPDNTLVLVSDKLFQFTLASTDAEVILKDMTLLQGSDSNGFYFESNSGTKGKVIGSNIDYVNFGAGTVANGVSTNGIKDTKMFNVRAFDIVRDGFNYHNTKEVNGGGTVFEYNCYAENTGLEGTTNNNNISTAHEGIHILRVGTKGRDSKGPLIADVNGCHSANIDVEVYGTGITSLSAQNTAFWFDDNPNTQSPNPNGKAWLVNCAGGDGREWGINTDESFKKQNKVFVDNFKGANIQKDVVLTKFYQ